MTQSNRPCSPSFRPAAGFDCQQEARLVQPPLVLRRNAARRCVAGVVGQAAAQAWKFFAKVLWFQGLRVKEALHLSWDQEDLHRVDLGQKYPVIWIRAELEKGKKDRIHPMAPELAELLRGAPESRRTGLVFDLPGVERTNECRLLCWSADVLNSRHDVATL
jgi:integrase